MDEQTAIVVCFIIVPFIWGIFILIKSRFVVKEGTVVIIERLGKFHRACEPGAHFMAPFIDRKAPFFDDGKMVKYVELRERTIVLPKQRVATEDNVHIEIAGTVFYAVSDPVKVVYHVGELSAAIRQRIAEELRNAINEVKSADIDNNRGAISKVICERAKDAGDAWGITIRSVALQG